MKIYKKDIGRMASSFLEELRSGNVNCLDEMKIKCLDHIIRYLSNKEEIITFDKKEHFPPTGIGISYIVSYVMGIKGIPIEFRVNEIAGCAIVILKAQNKLEGYTKFVSGYADPFKNIYQNKENRLGNFNLAVRELEELAKLK